MIDQTLLLTIPGLALMAALTLAPLFLDVGRRSLLNALVGVLVIGGAFLALEELGLSALNPLLPFLGGLLVGYLEGLKGSLLRVGAAMGMFTALPMAGYVVFTEIVVGPYTGSAIVGPLTMPITNGVTTALYVMALGTGAAFVAASMVSGVSAYERGDARLDYGLDDEEDDGEDHVEDDGEGDEEDDGEDHVEDDGEGDGEDHVEDGGENDGEDQPKEDQQVDSEGSTPSDL